MLRFHVVVIATVFLAACGSDDPTGPGGLDVSGVWTASIAGTVFNGEDGTGQTTSFRLTLVQSGTEITGTETFTDTLGRSGSSALSGTFIGTTFGYSSPDFDPACGARTIARIATVTITTPGSTMSISAVASPAGSCPPLFGELIYTKQ